MYAAGALRRLLVLNEATWRSQEVSTRAGKLLSDITHGLEKWGTTKAPDGSTVYAYEVCVGVCQRGSSGGFVLTFITRQAPTTWSGVG